VLLPESLQNKGRRDIVSGLATSLDELFALPAVVLARRRVAI